MSDKVITLYDLYGTDMDARVMLEHERRVDLRKAGCGPTTDPRTDLKDEKGNTITIIPILVCELDAYGIRSHGLYATHLKSCDDCQHISGYIERVSEETWLGTPKPFPVHLLKDTRNSVFKDTLIGWELEVSNHVYGQKFERRHKDVEHKSDGSLSGDRCLEIVLREPQAFEKSLETLKEVITKYEVQVNKTCGFHVHVGLQPKNKKSMINNLLIMGTAIEDDMYGSIPDSRSNNQYCLRIGKRFKVNEEMLAKKVGQVNDSKYNNDKRYCWLNIIEMIRNGGLGTIEIRSMGDAKDFIYLSNWIYFAAKFVNYANVLDLKDAVSVKSAIKDLRTLLSYIKENKKLVVEGKNTEMYNSLLMREINLAQNKKLAKYLTDGKVTAEVESVNDEDGPRFINTSNYAWIDPEQPRLSRVRSI